jgi:hypothetical protein
MSMVLDFSTAILGIFFAVVFEMGLHRLFSVSPAVNYVAPSYVSMVCSLLVTSRLVMLGRFPVMVCGMSDALMLFMMLRSFL